MPEGERMKRTNTLALVWIVALVSIGVRLAVADSLPPTDPRAPVAFDHFPDRLHAFVWRNWEMVSLERMAQVLDTTPEKIRDVGLAMGLPAHRTPPALYQQRGYITIIRRNWHLLPYEQLLELLGWDADQLAFALREDDFLWIKLGSFKPSCPTLRYAEPNEATAIRCEQIRETVASGFAEEFAKPWTPRFDFLRGLSGGDSTQEPRISSSGEQKIRFLYSYCGVFGDPLLNPGLDPYPDGLLKQLSDLGVNGVWLHVVLRQLAPSALFPEESDNCEKRIATLRRLVERAREHGIDIYLYMNEPRAMEASFFQGREHIRGQQEGSHYALCTSTPEVRQWLADSLTYVFKQAPQLGGVFTITASENFTNCYSHSHTAAGCPRCSKRSGPEVIAEVNRTIADAVRAGSPTAKVIVWDWGWSDGTDAGWGKPDWASQIIDALPQDVYLMCVSEWGKPIVRGGVASGVGEYSLSAVGPGPRALRHWGLAKKRGLKTLAKVQVNCSWELSAVPYLPVMDLVARHCRNLADTDIDGLMLSWSVGGYPSPNLELVKCFESEPVPTVEQALATVARSRYGAEAAPLALTAWSKFSDAFAEYPFHGGFVYTGPMQCGPSNLVYSKPTGYVATMVGFPYDDLERWRAIYPAEVLAGQFEKIAGGWEEGLAALRNAQDKTATSAQRVNLHTDLVLAEAAGLHIRSVANQVRFIMARNALLSGSLQDPERKLCVRTARNALQDEIRMASRLFTLTQQDSRIGFEASNHYYYLPLDLVEKAVNCRHILDTALAGAGGS
jgi:hypothetical protein